MQVLLNRWIQLKERLNPNAIPCSIKHRLRAGFYRCDCIYLLMKAYAFGGEKGENFDEIKIPENLVAEAEKMHHELIEKIVENDEGLMNRYLEGEEIGIDDLRKNLRKATIEGKIIPVFCGSALRNKGVQFLLDGIVDYLPSPLDLPPVKGLILKPVKN
jgi:elongation factor G